MIRSVRHLAVAAAAVVAATAGLLSAGPAAPASATSYRYWSVWLGGSSWQYGSFNPGYQKVGAGDVVGWRFAVQGDAGGAIPPRQTASYDQLCGGHPGTVAVVVDFGTTADEPPAESPPYSSPQVRCQPEAGKVSVDQVTQSAGFPLRICPNGLVGGIDGYPRSECAPAVTAPAATAPAAPPAAGPAAPAPAAVPAPHALAATPAPGGAATTGPVTPSAGSPASGPSGSPAAAAEPATTPPGTTTAPAARGSRADPPAEAAQPSALGRSWPAGLAVLLAAALGAAAYLRSRRSA